MKLIIWRLMLILSVLPLFGCNLQNNFLYHPDSSVPSRESLAAEGIQYWPSQSDYRGFAGSTPEKNGKGTVVVFHGNAGAAWYRGHYVRALAPLGYRVVLAEYPAYGGRTGELGEAAFVKDANETIRLASEQFGRPIFLLGESLGCGVAAAAAGTGQVPIDGIILITPWDSLLSVAKEKFPWLPVRLFLSDKYDTIGNVKTFRGKIAIVGAERDEIIPVRHAETLYQSIPGNKKMWVIRKAGHNDWPDAVGPSWWKEIMEFMQRG